MSTEVILDKMFHLRERMPTRIFHVSEDAASTVAAEVATLIRIRAAEKKNAVILCTIGSATSVVYDKLIEMHKKENLSFENVVAFVLDEYLPVVKNQLQSHARFMHEVFFDQVDMKPENIHVLDGSHELAGIKEYCEAFERSIQEVGGIDYAILTVNGNGNIGFNNHVAHKDARTRLIYLSKAMRTECASDFFGPQNVPKQALAMGPGDVFSAKRIALLCFGEGRAKIVRRIVEEPATQDLVISFLQTHGNATLFADTAAAAHLTCIDTPWLLTGDNSLIQLDWTEEQMRRAVIWLALRMQKPILRLEDGDYRDNNLTQLLDLFDGKVHEINLKVHHFLRIAITGWPGGRRPGTFEPAAKALPHPTLAHFTTDYDPANALHKRIMCFSPHPDDDVISMGGTLIRLCDQGHEVHTVYETSGNIAVFDDEAIRYCRYVVHHLKMLGDQIPPEAIKACEDQLNRILDYVSKKDANNGWADNAELLQIKSDIRRQEALSAAMLSGCLEKNVHFLNLPFYQTGTVRKSPITDVDVEIVLKLLREVKPEMIFAAGDLSDPHGTHRMALKALLKAVEKAKAENDEWTKNCVIYLYRGAWQEWEPEKVNLVVPMSADELYRKRLAIYRHQSQKDPAPYPGTDSREFWQRSEERNRNTARLFDKLGLSEFEAMETFVLYNPDDVLCKALLN